MGLEALRKRKSLIEPLVTTASALGIVQGLTWAVLSLIAILYYEEQIGHTAAANGTRMIGDTIFASYLDKATQDHKDNSIIIGPKEFNYFMYPYLLLSFSLLVVSSVILWATITEKSGKHYKARLYCWTINMAVLSLLDLILVSLIAHDYNHIKKTEISTVSELALKTLALVTVGIVMTIAARGFVLWIINVTFVVILGKHLHTLYKKDKGPKPAQSILDAYSTNPRPPWEMSNSLYADTNSGYNNKGFRDDNDGPMITSSQSFTHLPLNDRDNYKNRDNRGNNRSQNQSPFFDDYGNSNNNWNKRNQGDNRSYGLGANNSPLRPLSQPDNSNQWGQPTPLRTAKIGRQGGQRSPPLNVNPPYIPDPDYSPPGSPRVKGVLRPKSNYLY